MFKRLSSIEISKEEDQKNYQISIIGSPGKSSQVSKSIRPSVRMLNLREKVIPLQETINNYTNTIMPIENISGSQSRRSVKSNSPEVSQGGQSKFEIDSNSRRKKDGPQNSIQNTKRILKNFSLVVKAGQSMPNVRYDFEDILEKKRLEEIRRKDGKKAMNSMKNEMGSPGIRFFQRNTQGFHLSKRKRMTSERPLKKSLNSLHFRIESPAVYTPLMASRITEKGVISVQQSLAPKSISLHNKKHIRINSAQALLPKGLFKITNQGSKTPVNLHESVNQPKVTSKPSSRGEIAFSNNSKTDFLKNPKSIQVSRKRKNIEFRELVGKISSVAKNKMIKDKLNNPDSPNWNMNK